jgi:hypothetical protein
MNAGATVSRSPETETAMRPRDGAGPGRRQRLPIVEQDRHTVDRNHQPKGLGLRHTILINTGECERSAIEVRGYATTGNVKLTVVPALEVWCSSSPPIWAASEAMSR